VIFLEFRFWLSTASNHLGLDDIRQSIEAAKRVPSIPIDLLIDEDASDIAKIFCRYNFISNIVQEIRHS